MYTGRIKVKQVHQHQTLKNTTIKHLKQSTNIQKT